jgi:tRNA modification GTPase
MEMITSRTEEGRRIAMAHLQGVLSRTIRPLYQRLIDLLAHLEASIDFCEQGIQVYTEQELVQEMEILLSRSVALLETYRAGRIRREGANTVLAGRPNVGKSSLLNALLGEDRAIVTPFPGTTRDILQEYLPLEGITLRLSDMAGLRPTPEPIEQEGVRRAEAILEGADLILLVLDGSVPLQEQDRLLIRKLSGKRVLIVLNKSDLPIRLSEEEVKTVAPNLPLVVLSALTGSGIGELKKSIWRALSEDVSALEEGVLTQARHAHALERGRIALERALETARRGFSWEFVASDLQIARKNLGEILGEEVSDEVIEAIFKRFCIGK